MMLPIPSPGKNLSQLKGVGQVGHPGRRRSRLSVWTSILWLWLIMELVWMMFAWR